MPSLSRNSPTANWRARWKEGGRVVNWNTGTTDKAEAGRRATEELGKRRATSPSRPGGTTNPSPDRLPSSSAPRRSLADLLRQAAPAPAAEPTPPTAPPPPSSSSTALVPAPAPEVTPETAAKVRHLHEVASKIGVRLIDGALQRACRWAGKEPDEMDEDEEDLIREGLREASEEMFGRVKLSPWGKVGLGAFAAGAGMYMGGQPIKKPTPLPPVEKSDDAGGEGA